MTAKVTKPFINRFIRTTEARAAGEAGLRTTVVSREDGDEPSEEDAQQFNVIDSLMELVDDADVPDPKRLDAKDDADDSDDDDVVDDDDDLDGDLDDDVDDGEDDDDAV